MTAVFIQTPPVLTQTLNPAPHRNTSTCPILQTPQVLAILDPSQHLGVLNNELLLKSQLSSVWEPSRKGTKCQVDTEEGDSPTTARSIMGLQTDACAG